MALLDALAALIATLREAGGTLRRDGDLLRVRFGRLDTEERAAVLPLLRRHKLDILAFLDAEAVATVFPGARIVPCPSCGGLRWRRAGDGEVCVRCHPAPQAVEPTRRRRVA
jgi:hypothetical protein